MLEGLEQSHELFEAQSVAADTQDVEDVLAI
ncbi:Uncharacterised protein [Mycobacteroides abscessus subsp. abscessus]|nr:Uncharacterised protein [Mycobacteroides abscessus subsp. abscessus]